MNTPLDRARLETSGEVELHDVLVSTQARAKEAARSGAPHGFAVFAERQEQGRGRLGRVWEAPSGAAVLVTMVLRPTMAASQAPLLCLAAAVATVEAIEATREVGIAPYGIKWPNDVLAPDARKVAGILAEADPRRDGTLAYALMGVGINVHAAPPLDSATCLDDVEGARRDRTGLAVALMSSMRAWADRLAAAPQTVLDRWRRDQITLGRRVRIGSVAGTAVDIEPSGALLVRDVGGTLHRITTGDVEMVGRISS